MRKLLIIVCIAILCIGCGDKVQSSNIDWMIKIQDTEIAEGFILDIVNTYEEPVRTNELNALLTIVMGLRDGLFEFDKDEFNILMDEYVYYPVKPKFASVCNELGVKVKDW
jgi:hypothetical protein